MDSELTQKSQALAAQIFPVLDGCTGCGSAAEWTRNRPQDLTARVFPILDGCMGMESAVEWTRSRPQDLTGCQIFPCRNTKHVKAAINSGAWDADTGMTFRMRVPVSPSPKRSPIYSPALSAVRPSPLARGSSGSCPVASSPFNSSPVFSFTQMASSPSPDLFDDWAYTHDMDDDLRRIDSLAAEFYSSQARPANASQGCGVHDSLLASPPTQKTWVVFRGKTPGVYENGYASPCCTE